jgi:hypothetical protein
MVMATLFAESEAFVMANRPSKKTAAGLEGPALGDERHGRVRVAAQEGVLDD